MVPSAATGARVRSDRFGDNLAGSGDDLDGGVFVAATRSLGVAVRGMLGPVAQSRGMANLMVSIIMVSLF